jgi:hypothetical protein
MLTSLPEDRKQLEERFPLASEKENSLGGEQGLHEKSLFSPLFCCELKSALKKQGVKTKGRNVGLAPFTS